MVDSQDLYYLIEDPVNNNVGQSRENQLAGSVDSPFAPSPWKFAQLGAAIVQGCCHFGCRNGIVFLDMLYDTI